MRHFLLAMLLAAVSFQSASAQVAGQYSISFGGTASGPNYTGVIGTFTDPSVLSYADTDVDVGDFVAEKRSDGTIWAWRITAINSTGPLNINVEPAGDHTGRAAANLQTGDAAIAEMVGTDVSFVPPLTLHGINSNLFSAFHNLNDGAALENVVEDTTPQLGGSLDVNSNKIVSTSNGNIDIEPNGTGNVLLGNVTIDADQTIGAGQDNYVMTYDNGSGLVSLEAAAGGGTDAAAIHDDTAGEIAAITEKGTPISADLLIIEDSASGNVKKRVQIGNLPGVGSGGGYIEAQNATADSNVTGTLNKKDICDPSGFSADRTYTLPSSASLNDRCGVGVNSGSASFELLIKTGGVGSLIDGVDYSTNEWSRLFIAGENATFLCVDGSGPKWIVEEDGRKPCIVDAYLSTSCDGETASTWTVPTAAATPGAWTENEDRGGVFNTSTGTFVARRASRYQISFQCYSLNVLADQALYRARMIDVSSNVFLWDTRVNAAGSNNQITRATRARKMVADASLQLQYFSSQGSRGMAAVASSEYSFITIAEKF